MPRGAKIRPAIDAFLHKAINYTGTDCLRWPFYVDRFGYARLRRLRMKYGTISVSSAVCGPPPTPKHEAAHSCHNGCSGCVNNKHLRWATHRDNSADVIFDALRIPMKDLFA
jgi:hypothetical protein